MVFFFFLNERPPTEFSTLPLHNALPIKGRRAQRVPAAAGGGDGSRAGEARLEGEQRRGPLPPGPRSEEHTSELQSRQYLVCRLLLEKKKKSKHCPYILLPKHTIYVA